MKRKISQNDPNFSNCADPIARTLKKGLGDLIQTMLPPIPIEYMIFMRLAIHDESDDFFEGEVEQRLQCIFGFDALLADIVV